MSNNIFQQRKNLILIIFFLNISNFLTAQDNVEMLDLSKPKNGKTFVIAHRGAHNYCPENTIAAYKKAIELNCDFIEIDVRKTKDGKFVSIHNSKIDEYVYGSFGKVNDFTLCELKKMNISKKFAEINDDEKIPTLEEILELCKGKIGIYLDLKDPFVEEISAIIKKYEMEKNVLWYIPFSYLNEIKKLKEVCEECLSMPDPGTKENLLKLFYEINPKFIATDMSQLDSEFVAICHKNNAKVFVDEEIGNEREWQKIIELGVEGIQTDNPEMLIQYLNNSN
ncbi:MAG: glycerophosphodiester phosphodiesterase family protein [Ignavibacteriae bacterium]|nr:glycerophosphodiester phosphodiesterase family protein [Ignavibacteriota bacterium]